MAADMKIQKINDPSESNSVDQITDGAAEYQREPRRKKWLRRGYALIKEIDKANCNG